MPIGMLIGYFIVRAEPAVHVLNQQVEEITAGSHSRQRHERGPVHRRGGCRVGLAMMRVLTGISIMWFLMPGLCAGAGA